MNEVLLKYKVSLNRFYINNYNDDNIFKKLHFRHSTAKISEYF